MKNYGNIIDKIKDEFESGKAIYNKTSGVFLTDNYLIATNSGLKLIDLNESEMESIKYYNQGEALFICGNKRMKIQIVITQEELDSFGSGGGY